MNATLDPTRLDNALATPGRALAPGTRIGSLEILRVIAADELGIDYLARDASRSAQVVLTEYLPQRLAQREGRTVRPNARQDAEAFERGLHAFVDEARLLARARHLGLVRVLEVVEANGTACRVVQPHAGVPLLRSREALPGPPDERAVRTLLEDLLGALDALHRSGTLHGAVSPEHVLHQAGDHALLLGPDLARRLVASDLVESLMAAVEPSFAAPEQREPSLAQPIGPWTDLYALAETVRFFIVGDLPPPAVATPGDLPRETLAQRLDRTPDAMRYSRELLDTLAAALAADPRARPQSVDEFRSGIAVTPPPGPEVRASAGAAAGPRVEPVFDLSYASHRVPNPRRRSSRTAWMAGGALALLVVAGGYALRKADKPVSMELAAPAVPAPMPAPVLAPKPITETAGTIDPPVAPPSASAALVPVAPVPVPAPAAARKPAPAAPAAPAAPTSPREACAGRTQFALYRCMQNLCEQRGWSRHPQCERLRTTDRVD